MDLKPIIEESFIQYSGAVLQSRALVDVRDCVKPSARQIFYCLYTDKFTHDKPFKKTLKCIGSASRMYIHGDSSCEGVIMRSAQPFAMRYPLVEVEGSYGNLIESGNWAAPRYTSSRLSEITELLFSDIGKDTIDDWRDNYDDTEKYPSVLPTKGFYNICNGTMGIGVGAASSIPQFNIKELNECLIKLLSNPSIDDEELIILPDFATGGVLLNPKQVRESLKKGEGEACQLRAVMTYDPKENVLIVTEMPFSVYTNTVCKELEAIIESENNIGIERFNDLTGEKPLIKIYLSKRANPNKVSEFLYKNTSLQYWYSINLTMLDGGKFPKVFTWKQALQAHIDHEKEVYRRSFEYDVKKAKNRIHILDGLLIAIANIDEVVKIIKESNSVGAAKQSLIKNFVLDEEQATAILDTKLSRLARLEVNKLQEEKQKLLNVVEHIEAILNNTELFNNELINGWKKVAAKYGDDRRTKVENDEVTAIPTKEPENMLYTILSNGTVMPLSTNESKISLKNYTKQKCCAGFRAMENSRLVFVDKAGKYTCCAAESLCEGQENSIDIAAITGFVLQPKQWILSISKNGYVKKTSFDEYNGFKRSGNIAKVKEDDSIVFAAPCNDSDFALILSGNGNIIKVAVSEIAATGKTTLGKRIAKDGVIDATIAAQNDKIFTIQENKGKVTLCSTYNNGSQKVHENTIALSKIEEYFYIAVDGNVLSRHETGDYVLRGKTASGVKLTSKTEMSILA